MVAIFPFKIFFTYFTVRHLVALLQNRKLDFEAKNWNEGLMPLVEFLFPLLDFPILIPAHFYHDESTCLKASKKHASKHVKSK